MDLLEQIASETGYTLDELTSKSEPIPMNEFLAQLDDDDSLDDPDPMCPYTL